MPYYVFPKGITLATAIESSMAIAYDDPREAHERRKAGVTIGERDYTASELEVVFQCSEDESVVWQERERSRFACGEYVRVPWADVDAYPLHFVHLSVKTPGLIAYTKDDEHGMRDRQTAIRPGRYLEQYYPHIDKQTRDRWIGECSAQYLDLQITDDPDTIVEVYTADDAPDSCMAHGIDDYEGSAHPVSVYGGRYSDLALAYYGDLDAGIVRGRAIVWPARMIHGRIYGNESVMLSLLHAAGYTSGSMRGARISAIKDANGNGWIMPYVDGVSRAKLSDDRRSFVLGDGSVPTQNTNGVTGHQPDFSCDWCGYQGTDDEYGRNGLCQDCYDRSILCDECDELHDPDETTIIELTDGRSICESCADSMRQTCIIDGCDTEWIEAEEFTARETADRDARHINELCRDCADRFRYCESCESYTAIGSDECEECGTADLPLDANANTNEVSTCDSPF